MKRILIPLLGLLILASSAQAQRNRGHQISRWSFMTSVGYVNGVGHIDLKYPDGSLVKSVDNSIPNFQIHQLLAYQFDNIFTMGIETGFDIWRHTAFIPVCLNLSINMTDYTKVAPMTFLNLGWGFKWYGQTKPESTDRVVHGTNWGPTGDFGLGMRVRFTDKLSLVIAGVYKMQFSKIGYSIVEPGEQDYSDLYPNQYQNAFYHFAGVKIGIAY